jgi:hypothetical protein
VYYDTRDKELFIYNGTANKVRSFNGAPRVRKLFDAASNNANKFVNLPAYYTSSGMEVKVKNGKGYYAIQGKKYDIPNNSILYKKTYIVNGQFKGGEKVWFQLKSEDLKLSNDRIEGYISGFNSFDGRTSLAFGNSNVTVSCQNTFWKGYKDVETKLRHSSAMKPKIEEILRKIDLLLEEEKQTFDNIQRLGNVRMTEQVKELVIRRLFDIQKEERLDSDDLSTNKKNKLSRFYIDLNGELNQKGDNLWGLFSGVTKYTTHSMKKGDNTEGKIFGQVGFKERQIWDNLVELV